MIDQKILRAKQAMAEISHYTQEQTDALIAAISETIIANAEMLAREAVAETKMGRLDHKIGKNTVAGTNLPTFLKGKKSVGVINRLPELGLVEIAHPVGVIGSVTPTTNPTVTSVGNTVVSLKGRNAIIISPHPRAKATTIHTVELMREAIAAIGAPKDLIQIIEEPSQELTKELMSKSDMNVATGGPGLVHAAYTSGIPSYGVGPGNTQGILTEDFDVAAAVELSIISRSFDNGLICACAQTIIYPEKRQAELRQEFEKRTAVYFDQPADVEKIRRALFIDGQLNPAVVGQSPQFIGELAGLPIKDEAEIIVVQIEEFGAADVLCQEKMCPVLAAIPYREFADALEICQANLEVAGKGHSVAIYSHDDDKILQLGLAMPVCRIIVNQPSIDAAGGPGNGLNPTPSLGCGSWGKNIISENLRYDHLLNISRIAYPLARETY
ncbi:aldehyde dehydrogenase family protein [Enterococcus sp. LJL90]